MKNRSDSLTAKSAFPIFGRAVVTGNITSVNNSSPPNEKIALFRSLFRGRTDVFPKRFENRRTGKSGYSPTCSNEWVRGICDKPRVKCSACQHQQFVRFDDEVVRWHLIGNDDKGNDFVAGIYPMLLDETCLFLAIDFDKAHWQADVSAVLDTCARLNVPTAMERSRSGNGAHVWFFFGEAVPAVSARKLGAHILTLTMEQRPDIGLDSYDRLFPNQDTLPHGGFGNLIALPLQAKPRKKGNSVFLNEQFAPHEDQWEYLSSVRKMSPETVDELVGSATKQGQIVGVRMPSMQDDEPWNITPSRKNKKLEIDRSLLPEKTTLTLGDQIYIRKEGLSAPLRNRLVRIAAFQNPEFYKAQAMRLSIFGKPRIISCAEDYSQHLALPRGCFEDVEQLFMELGIDYEVVDERTKGDSINVEFNGELRPGQKVAEEKMLAHDIGVLSATTAFGKTVVAASLIASRGVSTLVLVHRRQLMIQWVDRLSTFLGLSKKEIGRIGAGKKKPNGQIDVGMIQSLVRNREVNDCVADYGHIVVDECHHLSALSFELVARRAKAKYVTGLSATITRKDGHHPIIFMQCGPVRHRVDARSEAMARPFEHTVIVRPTSFHPLTEADLDKRVQFQDLCRALIADKDRNDMICSDILKSVEEGRSPIVLTERIEHIADLTQRLESKEQNIVVLQGGASAKATRDLDRRLSEISSNEQRVLIATGRFVGEGFDDSRLDTLFLTMPVSWHGTVAQYVGRLHRLREDKREVRVFDYADLNVPMLTRMFDRRCSAYESVGYRVMVPGSAVPGWPVEVDLPVDPIWKNEYAASVRRLVRDGVDAPLAKLFVQTAKKFEGLKGIEQAESASEAFLYRRLETLPGTSGSFRLNCELPISFDRWGKMEVDLVSDSAKLAIEIDGSQHLDNKDAYRRDRRKDALLQEHGYFVLRFLAEDIGRDLDKVLDVILRTVENRV